MKPRACSVQHMAGMKQVPFIIAFNKVVE